MTDQISRSCGQAALVGVKVLEPLLAIAIDENSAPAFMRAAVHLAQEISESDLNALASLVKVSNEIFEAILLTRALIDISGHRLTDADIDKHFTESA